MGQGLNDFLVALVLVIIYLVIPVVTVILALLAFSFVMYIICKLADKYLKRR